MKTITTTSTTTTTTTTTFTHTDKNEGNGNHNDKSSTRRNDKKYNDDGDRNTNRKTTITTVTMTTKTTLEIRYSQRSHAQVIDYAWHCLELSCTVCLHHTFQYISIYMILACVPFWGTLIIILGGVCHLDLKTLTLFQTKISDLLYPISDPYSINVYPISDLFLRLFSFATVSTCFFFHSPCIVCGDTFLYILFQAKNTKSIPISDQKGKLYTLFQTKNVWKQYPLGWHIPIWHIYKSTPPPPLPHHQGPIAVWRVQ